MLMLTTTHHRSTFTTQHLILLMTFLLHETPCSLGGNCWLNVNKNGRCTALVKAESTREECCDGGPFGNSASVAWNEEDLTPSSMFYMHVQGGVPCSRCKDSCDGIKCPENQKCAVRNGFPKCVCAPNCSSFRLQNGIKGRSKGPVCGSDGRTYKSPCRLLKRACRRKTSLSISYYGPCRMSCSKLMCPGKKMCLLDQNMIPHCVNCTFRHCSTATGKSVCGVDGITYSSICHLRQAACQRGKAIQVAYKGSCKKRANCGNVKCNEGQSCLMEPSTGKPRCVTCSVRPKWCRITKSETGIKGPLCSTNGKTYKNWCEMTDDACSSGIALDTKHFGKCRFDNSTGIY